MADLTGIQINSLSKVSAPVGDDCFVISSPTSGTRRIGQSDVLNLIKANNEPAIAAAANNAAAHRNAVPRYKNLGTEFTTAQSQAVQNGSFTDMYVGDYWVINGKTRRIADIDPLINCGDSFGLGHHLMIVDDGLDLVGDGSTTHWMQDTNTTDGGFKGSKMWTDTIPNKIIPDITTAFGDHLYSHREYISNAVTDGAPSGGEWVDATYMLFNEAMVYGSVVNGATAGGAGLFNVGIGKSQVKLFELDPQFMNRRQIFWLRDVVSASHFAIVYADGGANRTGASNSWGGVLGYYLIH